MFCGNCGKNIGDLKVCPYCNPTPQPQEVPEYQAPAQPVEPFPAADAQPPVPEEEENHTVLFSGVAEEPAPVAPPVTPPEYPAYQQPVTGAPYNQNNSYQPPVQQTPYPYPPVQPAPAPAPAPAPEQKEKKSKKGPIIAIIVILVVLLAGGGVAAFFLTAPMRNYSKAMDLKDKGEYKEAITILEDLNDYEDSADQITDCQYLYAKQLIDDGEYSEARDILTSLNDYEDSKDQITKCDYLEAKSWLEEGKYDEAKAVFKRLGKYEESEKLIQKCDYEKANQLLKDKKYADAKKLYKELGAYEDSKEKIKECDYNIAKGLIESKPAEAIELLEDVGNYQDSKKLLQQAKMSYCKKNKKFTDKNTYKYLKELKDAKYKGAAEMYKELYTLKVTNVFWNTDSDNETQKLTKISSGKDAVLHFDLTGYTPDTYYFHVLYEVTAANGEKLSRDASGIYHRFTYTLQNAPKGTLKVDIYDTSNNGKNKLYTASVQIV